MDQNSEQKHRYAKQNSQVNLSPIAHFLYYKMNVNRILILLNGDFRCILVILRMLPVGLRLHSGWAIGRISFSIPLELLLGLP